MNVSLREVCLSVETTEPRRRPDGWLDYIDISSIDRSSKRIVAPKRLRGQEAPSRARQLVREGDIVFSTVRPNLRTIARVPRLLDGQVASTGFCLLRPSHHISPEFVFHAVLADDLQDRVLGKARGVAYPAVREADILEELIPLPPRAEQDRIVQTLSLGLDALAIAEESLSRAMTEVPRYEASILAAAVTGELVSNEFDGASGHDLLNEALARRHARWASDGLGRYSPPIEPQPPSDVPLPDGWTWATVDQLSVGVQYGTSAKARPDVAGVPVLRMGNIVAGRLELSDLKYLPPDHSEFPGLFLRDGDLLFNRTNSPELVGKAAVAQHIPRECSFASYLIRVRFVDEIQPELVGYFLNSGYGRRWVREAANQQVGQANVNGSKLRALTIPLPPRDVQQRVSEQVDRLLAQSRALRGSLESASSDATVLRRSLLDHAMTGRLVPQDPSDEAASELVERVKFEKAEREPAGAQPRRRSRSVPATAS